MIFLSESSKFPSNLYLEWDLDSNNKSLDEYALYSKYQAYWICSAKPHHKWQARLAHRVSYNTGCPYCANKILLVGENDLASQYPELVKEWSSNNAIKPNEIVFGYGKKIIWKCDKNHEWQDTVSNRTLLGRGCPYCNGAKPIVGENDLATLYPEISKQWSPKNSLHPSEVLPQSNRKPTWVCSKGHEWETSIAHRTKENTGCPYCSNQKLLKGYNDFETIHKSSHLLKEWSKNNELKPSQIVAGSTKKVIWCCNLKHEWNATISARLRGFGCPYCVNKTILKGYNDLATTHPELAKEWSLKNAMKPDQIISANDEKVWWKCDKGHEWEATVYARKKGKGGCPNCHTGTSSQEKELSKFLNKYNFTVKRNDRKLLKGLELDFYIPEKKLAIEFNGIYWHTESRGKPQYYHYNKWIKCKEQGIQLIQIWEDDWNRNSELIKTMLKAKLGISSQDSVYARKTFIELISVSEAQNFMTANHIQGWYNGSYYIGLKDILSETLVALCIVKNEAGTDGKVLNIIRYATSKKVPGGFTKILSYVEKAYKPERIITFSDHTISDGNLYSSNGFYAEKEIKPDYQYVVKGERKHKFGYRLKRFETDPELKWVSGYTETQLAKLNNLERIWDAGKTRWVKDIK